MGLADGLYVISDLLRQIVRYIARYTDLLSNCPGVYCVLGELSVNFLLKIS